MEHFPGGPRQLEVQIQASHAAYAEVRVTVPSRFPGGRPLVGTPQTLSAPSLEELNAQIEERKFRANQNGCSVDVTIKWVWNPETNRYELADIVGTIGRAVARQVESFIQWTVTGCR